MSSIVIVGTQWGDEGKGKIVDFLAEQAEVVARFQGGNNAGHTVVSEGKVYKLHLLPSGVLYPQSTCIIGSDVVVNPGALLAEIDEMAANGRTVTNLRISDRAHVLMPYHIRLDGAEERLRSASKVGTTGRGIGPCYQDAAARSGIRMSTFVHPERMRQALKQQVEYHNLLLTKVFGEEPLDFDKVYAEMQGYADRLRPFVADTSYLVNQALDAGKKVLFEGAQAAMLDLTHGTYPYVTSSHPTAGGVCVGLGIGPKKINKVLGVIKAYTTRVGEGPFPTELKNAIGDQIRETAHEYGTTTGRPRRCGWLDAFGLKYAAMINGLDCFALTRLDILDKLPEIKICVGYNWQGRKIDSFPADLDILGQVEPVYETFPGWLEDISGCRRYEDLPLNCRRYVEAIARLTGTKASIVSVGPDRQQTLVLEESMF